MLPDDPPGRRGTRAGRVERGAPVNEIQSLVDVLAARLGRPVGLDDRRFRAIAYSSHADEIDPVRRTSILGRQAPPAVTRWLEGLGVLRATEPVHVPPNRGFDMVARVCVPVRFHDRLLGFLWLIESDGLSDEQLALAQRCAGELAHELYGLHQQEREERRREVAGVRRLLSGDVPADADALEIAPDACYAVIELMVVAPPDRPLGTAVEVRLTEALDRARRAVAPRHQLAEQHGGGATVVVSAETDAEVARQAATLLTAATAELADIEDVTPVVGVGQVVASPGVLPEAHRQARLAARAARSRTDLGPLVPWERLGTSALVAELLGDRDPAELVPPALRRLLAAPDAALLARTLEAYLEHAGDAPAAAAELFVHRSSLYNRLHRIEELAGVDIRSGADRLELHLGLRLWRLAGGATSVEQAPATARRRADAGGDERA
jgi:DNA-binding PucR family transcriptional regulator